MRLEIAENNQGWALVLADWDKKGKATGVRYVFVKSQDYWTIWEHWVCMKNFY